MHILVFHSFWWPDPASLLLSYDPCSLDVLTMRVTRDLSFFFSATCFNSDLRAVYIRRKSNIRKKGLQPAHKLYSSPYNPNIMSFADILSRLMHLHFHETQSSFIYFQCCRHDYLYDYPFITFKYLLDVGLSWVLTWAFIAILAFLSR